MKLLCEHTKIRSGVCDLIVDTEKQTIEGYVPFWAGDEVALEQLRDLQRRWRNGEATTFDVIAFLRQHGYIIRGTRENFRQLERQYPNIWKKTRKQ